MIYLTREQKAFLLASNPAPTSKQELEIVEAVERCTKYDFFIEEAIRHGTYLILFNNLKRIKVTSRLARHIDELRQVSQLWCLIEGQYIAELERQVIAMTHCGIDVMLLKAFHMLTELPEYRGLRYFCDIDLLVRRNKTKATIKTLLGNGYSFGFHDRHENTIVPVKQDSSAERLHYELTPLVKACRLEIDYANISQTKLKELTLKYKLPIVVGSRSASVVVSLDIHWNVADQTDVESLWSTATRSRHFPGQEGISVMDPTSLLWYLTSKAYIEMCTGTYPYLLKSFFDVLLHVKRKWREIDAQKLLNISLDYNTLPAIFYFLSHLERTFRLRGAAQIIEVLAQGEITYRRGKDYGDFLPRMFDLISVHRLHTIP